MMYATPRLARGRLYDISLQKNLLEISISIPVQKYLKFRFINEEAEILFSNAYNKFVFYFNTICITSNKNEFLVKNKLYKLLPKRILSSLSTEQILGNILKFPMRPCDNILRPCSKYHYNILYQDSHQLDQLVCVHL